MPVHMIAYASRSLIPPAYADREISAIVAKSVEQNGRHGVTGALLYSDQQRFAQVLEGDRAAVSMIMGKIARDTRHSHIVMLFDGTAPQRRFPNWSLAF